MGSISMWFHFFVFQSQRGESVKGKGILTNMNAWTGIEM